ncbi:sporulation protein rmd1 [Podospora bellae-mahoneyi]|uniref:Sporulation protein rmd1 n=1 Tax=Podospora bellae-mahoneyi TaxID=2093777 RepID=A0ABR0F7G4_9PEZI|nr:sporulation protein rmd1 [Podospora bellae-mahoneyi]
MADTTAPIETTPLLSNSSSTSSVEPPSSPESATRPPKPQRNVTFNPNPVSKTIEPEQQYRTRIRTAGHHQHHQHQPPLSPSSPSAISTGGLGGGPPMLSALNNKLRRRNSHGGGGPSGVLPVAGAPGHHLPKIGPQRTTKNAQKLKLLPTPELEEDGADEESGREVYSQYTRIKDPTARRDAARLGKADRQTLPRVTAYCTANRYQMDGLMRFLKGKGKGRGANPKLIDECIYSPYSYSSKQVELSRQEQIIQVHSTPERRHSTGEVAGADGEGFHQQNLIDLRNEAAEVYASEQYGNGPHQSVDDLQQLGESVVATEGGDRLQPVDFDITVHTPEVFFFNYGVVVIWGMSASQEQRFLKEITKFELEKLGPDDVETEKFNFYYTHEYQPRIYNDFITLRDKSNYMTKLAISHALAQSVKTSLFEELIASTIEDCKDIPSQLALTGKIDLSRRQINMQIGELFILRIGVHLNGSVLDTPELFWVEPQLEPVYQAVRSYLEMDQRVGLLTERLDVIADLLAVLKDQLSHGHGEKLEWIVIVLIAAEIVVALVNIIVDLYVGID